MKIIISITVDSTVSKEIKAQAKKETRNLSNMIEVMAKQYLETIGDAAYGNAIVPQIALEIDEIGKRSALVPPEIVQKYGEEEVMKIIKNHKGYDDLIIDQSIIKFIVSKPS